MALYKVLKAISYEPVGNKASWKKWFADGILDSTQTPAISISWLLNDGAIQIHSGTGTDTGTTI